jgi:hypothetical protein
MQVFVVCGRFPHLVKNHRKIKFLSRGSNAFPKAYDFWVVDIHNHKNNHRFSVLGARTHGIAALPAILEQRVSSRRNPVRTSAFHHPGLPSTKPHAFDSFAPKPAVPGTVGLPKKSNPRQSFGYVQAVSDRASYRRRETTA